MGKRIGVVFTTLTDKQWKAFKLACVRLGRPMTEVLWEGAQELLRINEFMKEAEGGEE
uniref:Uncharacterized protein n=1 Tax=viral metagenome TaxID=1070528 RepID=A0A6M3XHB4_9ZZZZ